MLIAYIIATILIAFACGTIFGWLIEKSIMDDRIQIIEDRVTCLKATVKYKQEVIEMLSEILSDAGEEEAEEDEDY